uniref:protein max isoform X2 n=1 Tax=Myxine glutinosa TaxID=7769 RepID=UPI00358F9A38
MSDNDEDFESDADKRAHHNALERKRRDHIKDSFHGLRDSIPSLQGEKDCSFPHLKVKTWKGASRAMILNKATDYIQHMKRRNSSHQQDIDDLKRQNSILEQQVRALEKIRGGKQQGGTTGASGSGGSYGGTRTQFDQGSSSESEPETKELTGRKKLRTEAR